MWRRLTRVRGLARLQQALVAAALLGLAAMVCSLVLSPDREAPWDAPAFVAIGLLAVCRWPRWR